MSPLDTTPSSNLLDQSRAVIWIPSTTSKQERNAVELLRREVDKRTLIRWAITEAQPADATPLIVIGSLAALQGYDHPLAKDMLAIGAPDAAEGYRVRVKTDGGSSIVFVIGHDAHGVLYGVGHLLRTLRMSRYRVTLPADLNVETSPAYRLRGHQLGYRDKTNSYDGWDLRQWEQYLCDLAVFGTNAIEMIPPRSDDKPDSVHFPLPPLETMAGVSRIADEYGLEVWVWYPALDEDYADAATVEFALNEWAEVLRVLPHLTALMVPGGDPGHTRPSVLMALLEKQTHNLRRFHPDMQMWVSPQGYSHEWMQEFLGILRQGVDWLTGVVYGPWVYMPIAEFRQLIPERYSIRNYPDITHSLDCQLPVPDWDVAYALTEGREVINPRPLGEAAIFRHQQPHTIGFLTYSEGCHDDVNKAVWSRLGWDPAADVTEILREYSRYFIGERYTEDLAQGLLALERNWQGPLAVNAGVYTTLQQFQVLEAAASPHDLKNWRLQQVLYRAYYDAYVRSRLLFEEALEEQAMDQLRRAEEQGALLAMAEAEAILDRAVTHPIATTWRTRLFQLAEALFQSSAHMQLSVQLYQAQEEVRGASLDGCDYPLNNRLWLKARFDELRQSPDEATRLSGIRAILGWTNPGPGGFYNDLSNSVQQSHLVAGPRFEADPDFMDGPLRRFPYRKQPGALRRSWRCFTGAWHYSTFQMRYTDLDPDARYALRVVYSTWKPQVQVRLIANGSVEIHPFISRGDTPTPVEFDLPTEATRSGQLTLTWSTEHGRGGNPGGMGISEVWLIKR
jgi:hypothetical protein